MASSESSKSIYSLNSRAKKDLAGKIKTNPKIFWKYVKGKSKAAINKVYADNGSLTTNDKSTANVMNACVASVFVKDEDAQLPVLTDQHLVSQLSNFTITDKDVDKAISKINRSTSPRPGPDNIHPMLL